MKGKCVSYYEIGCFGQYSCSVYGETVMGFTLFYIHEQSLQLKAEDSDQHLHTVLLCVQCSVGNEALWRKALL